MLHLCGYYSVNFNSKYFHNSHYILLDVLRALLFYMRTYLKALMLPVHIYVLFTTISAVNMFERKLSHAKIVKRRVRNSIFYVSSKMVLILQILEGCYIFHSFSSNHLKEGILVLDVVMRYY